MGSPQNAALRHRLSSIRAAIQCLEIDLPAASPTAKPDIELMIRFFEDAEKTAKNEIELHELSNGGIEARKQACANPERFITNGPTPPSSVFDRTPQRPRRSREERIAWKKAELESELQKAEARRSELEKTINDWYLQALPQWETVTAEARARWTNHQKLAIEQFRTLKLHHERMLGLQATHHTTQPAAGNAPPLRDGREGHMFYDNYVPWENDVPVDLVPAVTHLRKQFDDAHFKFGAVTEYFCYSLLHDGGTDDDQTQWVTALLQMKTIVGPAGSQRFNQLLDRKTPSAIFKAFFDFYIEGLTREILSIFQSFVNIGLANEERLHFTAIKWAESQANQLIDSHIHNIDIWLRNVCDRQPHDPNADEDEQLYWKKWQAPAFLVMKPSRSRPFDPRRAWERETPESSLELRKMFCDDYLLRLKVMIRQAAGDMTVELAQQPAHAGVSSPKAAPDTSSPAEPSEAKIKPRPGLSFAEDFRSVLFDGTAYPLTLAQSKMMRVMWDAHKSGHPMVSKDRLLAAVESETSEVKDFWRGSSLWKTLLVSKKKGMYQLALEARVHSSS